MKQGGDTDTNCAIVGSLLGSVLGFKGLPKSYLSKIMNLNLPSNKNSLTAESWIRPAKYEPRR
jgi:ADP-ribosylglycohydrolase